jgi:hypothetical protein
MTRTLTFLPVNIVPIMAFLPQELLLLSISKYLSCKQDILGGSRYVSRQLYHHLPGGVGKKIAEFGSHTGHVQWTYTWNDTFIVYWTPFWLIISKEIEMLQKKNLKIPDKRYENWRHFENRGGYFENGRNLNGQRYFLFRY